jgi:hypothetical protein
VAALEGELERDRRRWHHLRRESRSISLKEEQDTRER